MPHGGVPCLWFAFVCFFNGVSTPKTQRCSSGHHLPPPVSWLCCVQGNHLTALPDCMAQLTALTELSISDNRLNVWPAGLDRLPRLKELWAFGNQLTDGPDGFLRRSPACERLWLERNPLSPACVQGLLAAAALKRNLRALGLDDVQMSRAAGPRPPCVRCPRPQRPRLDFCGGPENKPIRTHYAPIPMCPSSAFGSKRDQAAPHGRGGKGMGVRHTR